MSDDRAIGVFDSGLGGLTVVKELSSLMPGERIVYLGDSARCPYGGRSGEAIRRFGMEDAGFLSNRDVKMVVVACNTVSSVALDHIRTAIRDIPVIGVVVPGSRAAVLRTAEKKIGVIGTHATIRTGAYEKAIHAFDPGTRVYNKPCPLFVPLVEEGMPFNDITRLVSQYYLYELVDIGIDCLILGCTHYPLLMQTIQSTVGTRIELIDSALWTAKEAQDILTALDATAGSREGGLDESVFFVTDVPQNFEERATAFLGRPLPRVERIFLERLEQ